MAKLHGIIQDVVTVAACGTMLVSLTACFGNNRPTLPLVAGEDPVAKMRCVLEKNAVAIKKVLGDHIRVDQPDMNKFTIHAKSRTPVTDGSVRVADFDIALLLEEDISGTNGQTRLSFMHQVEITVFEERDGIRWYMDATDVDDMHRGPLVNELEQSAVACK